MSYHSTARCLREDDNSCRCQDPLLPEPRGELRAWKRAYSNNALKIQSLVKNGEATPDIAFVGESIVEAMSGTWFGAEGEGKLKDLKKLFDKNFNKSMGASLDGVALGIAGDTVRIVGTQEVHVGGLLIRMCDTAWVGTPRNVPFFG